MKGGLYGAILSVQIIMGTEFWWFYDVIAVAVILVCVFISGKKGVLKSILDFAGYILAVIVALSISGSLAMSLYTSNIRSSNIKKIEKHLTSDTFTEMLIEYIDSLEYNVDIKGEKLNSIFDSEDEKDIEEINDEIYKYINNINGRKVAEEDEFKAQLREGYAVVISRIIGKELNKFAAETAANDIRQDQSKLPELIQKLREDESQRAAAAYIADNYTAPAYRTIVRLVLFVALLVVIIIIALFVVRVFTGDKNTDSATSHMFGGLVGMLKGIVLVFAVAAIVRLYVILGNDSMLFFNFSAVEKSFIFKHLYDLVLSL